MLKKAQAIAIALVTSVDGVLVMAALLFMLAIGGYIATLWPAAPFWLLIGSIGSLAAVAFFVFIIVPIIWEFSDDYSD